MEEAVAARIMVCEAIFEIDADLIELSKILFGAAIHKMEQGHDPIKILKTVALIIEDPDTYNKMMDEHNASASKRPA